MKWTSKYLDRSFLPSPSMGEGKGGDEALWRSTRHATLSPHPNLPKPGGKEKEVCKTIYAPVLSRFTGDPNRPIENASWDDVQEFVRRLTSREGRATYRLPTEAEWEYAARAGTTTRWSFGDDASQLGRYAWYKGNARVQTHPVGQLQPNPWGLYDMHGNVWERVQDWYGDYTSGTTVDPTGPSAGLGRVSRGGGWSDTARFCRSAVRNIGAPGIGIGLLGFRLLRVAP